MKDLRVGFVDTFENCARFFTYVLSQKYNVIRDDVNPEVLFFSDEFFGTRNQGFNDHAAIKIFYTGENSRPVFRNQDFSITFDFCNSPYHYRLPLYVLEMWAITLEGWTKDIQFLIHKHPISDDAFDRKGISYIQSNANSHHRNQFMNYLMSQGFDIDCGGPHLNNTGYVIPREPRMHKLDFLRERKFNIAVENGLYPGYVTEKLLDAYYADTVPIYWGSPNIARDFNPKSFINVTELGVENAAKKILELDKDKDQYMEMLNQPAFHHNRMNCYTYFDEFHRWFDNALSIGKVR